MSEILNRYERDKNGNYIINVAVSDHRELFNNYDKMLPFSKRELNEDVVDFLTESLEEMHHNVRFFIRVDLPAKKKKSFSEEKVRESIKGYFSYLKALSRKSSTAMWRKTVIQFIVSIFLLISTVLMSKHFKSDSLAYHLIFESLSIAAWVTLWPVFSDFIFALRNEGRKRKTFQRVIASDVVFKFF